MEEIIKKIDDCKSREECYDLLANLNANDLAEISKHYSIRKRSTKAEMREAIVCFTIGYKLSTEAIRTLTLNYKRPT
jgi:hypothetical protein